MICLLTGGSVLFYNKDIAETKKPESKTWEEPAIYFRATTLIYKYFFLYRLIFCFVAGII